MQHSALADQAPSLCPCKPNVAVSLNFICLGHPPSCTSLRVWLSKSAGHSQVPLSAPPSPLAIQVLDCIAPSQPQKHTWGPFPLKKENVFNCVRAWLGHWDLSLQGLHSPVVAHGHSCPVACGTLVPQPGIKPECPALQGRFLTTRPPGKS